MTEALRLFRDIVQTRSISRAAEMNGLSQSAASQHVQELERRFQVTLLDRSRRPLAPTPAGRTYFEYCRDVIRREEEMRAALDEQRGAAEGTVRVSSIYSVGLSEMTRLEEEFARRRPGARLAVEYLRPERVYESVLEDRSDLGFVSYPDARRDLTVIPWRQERMVVVAAPSHALGRRRSIKPHELNKLPFVAFDEDLPIRREVDRYLRERNVSVDVVMHFDNIQMILQAVELGAGIGIVPENIIRREVSERRLCAIRVGNGELVRPLGVIHRRRKKFTPAAQAFLSLLEEAPAA